MSHRRTNAYRVVRSIVLYYSVPSTTPRVAHIRSERRYSWDRTFCGLNADRMVDLHATVAEAIGIDDCKSCVKAEAAHLDGEGAS